MLYYTYTILEMKEDNMQQNEDNKTLLHIIQIINVCDIDEELRTDIKELCYMNISKNNNMLCSIMQDEEITETREALCTFEIYESDTESARKHKERMRLLQTTMLCELINEAVSES